MAQLQLFAWPAGHSLSPVMHNAALRELGIPHRYEAVAVPPEGLEAAVAELRNGNVLGANVTVPHKQAVLPLLDSVTPEARRVGAVNTISRLADGSLQGANTDVGGFTALIASAGVQLKGDNGLKAVVIGAGGAARAAMQALSGHARISLLNRTVSRAEELARDFSDQATVETVTGRADEQLLAGADLIVNTTSVGMERGGIDPDESPLDAQLLPDGAVVLDMVYRPARTRLMRDAEARGLRAENGLEMLVQQGAASLRIWTGLQEVPVGLMRAAALEALGD